MKTQTHILNLALAAFALLTTTTSCLNDTPRDRIEEEQAISSPSSLWINSVGRLYNCIGSNEEGKGLQGTYRGIYDYSTFTTDEAIVPTRGADWYDGAFWQRLYTHQWDDNDQELYNLWCYLLQSVVQCNDAIALIDKHKNILTQQQWLAYNAEARAIRAMFYYYLVDLFGNVPLLKSNNTSVSEVYNAPRTEVFRFAFHELQNVAPHLANAHSNLQGEYYGRITQPVAYFLLAKLALNAEVFTCNNPERNTPQQGTNIHFTVDGQKLNAWQTTINYCQKLQAAGYLLEQNYADNFKLHNENSSENIFTIPMDKNLYPNEYQYLFRSRHYNHGKALGLGAENGACATISTVRAFGYGNPSTLDSRFKLNFYADTVKVDGQVVRLDNGKELVYMPLNVEIDLTASPYIKTAGARMAKYEVDRKGFLDGKLQDNDIVLYRYADVLLMMAEAKVRNGQSGQTEMDAVRTRAGMPTRTATLNNILQERLLELMWEGWRRQDLIRFGRFTQSYDLRQALVNENKGATTLFPIPSKAIESNGNLRPNSNF